MSISQRGFTLIETIIYILIIGMILSTISLFLLELINARSKTYAIAEVVAAAQLMQERLTDAVRHAEVIRVADSTFGTDPGVLSLEMTDPTRDPTVFSLTANDGQFQIAEAGGSSVTLTSDNVQISNLIFTNLTGADDTGIIRVDFTIQALPLSATHSFQYDQTFQTTLRIPLD